MSFREKYRKECPETIGEADIEFDNANYIEWLEKELEATNNSTATIQRWCNTCVNYNDILNYNCKVCLKPDAQPKMWTCRDS